VSENYIKAIYYYYLISRSGLFDRKYYLENYPDVRKADIDPLMHYIKHGWKEGRKPARDSDFFVSEELHVKAKNENINPLVLIIKNKPFILKNDISTDLSNEKDYFLNYQIQLKTALNLNKNNYVKDIQTEKPIENPSIKAIAFYLPQFHPIPENNEWWGKGFTEWTNVSKAVPQFIGHYQPRLPGELGFYDLRVPSTLREQVNLAKKYGLYGFCFYYYWFNGKRLLEKPLNLFIKDPKIDFPFCICWANENWTRRWDGRDQDILIQQEHTYEYDKNIIHDFISLFTHPNYIRVNNKPLLIVYRGDILKDPKSTLEYWREYAKKEIGVSPHILVAESFNYNSSIEDGFDGAVEFPPHNLEVIPCINSRISFLNMDFSGNVFRYEDLAETFLNRIDKGEYKLHKTVSPSWDNSARKIDNGLIFHGSTPEKYEHWLKKACEYTQHNFEPEERFLFINAWNEWAEGAYLEPDNRFGYAYLVKTLSVILSYQKYKTPEIAHTNGQTSDENLVNKYRKKYNQILQSEPIYSDYKEHNKIHSLLASKIDKLLSECQPKEKTEPVASIIIPVFNHFEDTLTCIKALAHSNEKTPFEIIIIDDSSSDLTSEVFSQCKTIVYLKNAENIGFLKSCNLAAKHASGEYYVLLNNDTVVIPGWLDSLIETIEQNPLAGLVGSKLIYPNGTLQEAGGVIWHDGTGINFGRDDDPQKPQYNYLREVDYCSAASVCIPKAVWNKLNGFDTLYYPAYYEDTDFAFRVREAGYQVLYQPLSEVIHFEGKTSGRDVTKGIKRFQAINQEKFFDRWKRILELHGDSSLPSIVYRNRNRQKHVLVIDVCTPKPDHDSGSVDTYNYLLMLRQLGFEVTFISVVDAHIINRYVTDLQKNGIECIYQPYLNSIEEYIKANSKYFDLIILFRAPYGGKYIDYVKKYAPQAKIVFNTVDLHFLREKRAKELLDTDNSIKLVQEGVTQELEIAIMKKADITILVSKYEQKLLNQIAPEIKTKVIPLPREIPGRMGGFSQRNDIVFIGGFLHKPNVDAVHYFVDTIWPKVSNQIPNCKFRIVGSNVPEEIKILENKKIEVVGFVPDLADIFSKCKLSVAPLRFGAGVKGKVITSLSYGVPCIATSIAVEGTGLEDTETIMIADEPEEFVLKLKTIYQNKSYWEKLSQNGLDFVDKNYSLTKFEKNLSDLLLSLNLKNNLE